MQFKKNAFLKSRKAICLEFNLLFYFMSNKSQKYQGCYQYKYMVVSLNIYITFKKKLLMN
jgi:hypothetical protein